MQRDFDRPDYRPLHAINAILLIGLCGFAVAAYPALPDKIPAHLGASGVTDWTSRDSGMWFLLPVLATVETMMMYALSSLADAKPGPGFNVPHKKRILQLPREGQRFALEPARAFLFAMATWMIVLMLIIQLEMWLAAHAGPSARRSGVPTIWLVLGIALLPLAGVWWLHRAIGDRIEAWNE